MGLRGRCSVLSMEIFLGQGTGLEAQRGSALGRQDRAASLEIRKTPGRDQKREVEGGH